MWRLLVALLTVQHIAKMLIAAGFGQHPRSIAHGRLMPHVLPMAAREIGHPIAVLILMIGDDRLVHEENV